MITGCHSETCESEVEQLLRETMTETGMPTENVRIERLAKPITHAFIYFKSEDERNKHVRSANMLSKELRGRKIKMTRSMDAEERYYQKRMEYVKHCTHMRHGKHVKVDLSSTSSTKTLNLRLKIKWKNGNFKNSSQRL